VSAFPDHFSGHAADYKAYRPVYPPALFQFLADVAPRRDLAWDCGTGNGQAAVALAGHFDRVIATDASANQISQAEPHPRVEYRVGPAEAAPLADGSADLVTVAQALHWFRFDEYYAEVRRVARPGAVLAAWSYDLCWVNPAVDPVLERLQTDFVGPCWPPERAWVDARYETIPFPFAEVPAPRFELTAAWDLPRLLAYLGTWSATKAFQKAHGFDPLERLRPEFAAAWGDPATPRTVRWGLNLRVGRVG
jgi:SAM-dependent methyltransferase